MRQIMSIGSRDRQGTHASFNSLEDAPNYISSRLFEAFGKAVRARAAARGGAAQAAK
jgi:hypothetical protein